MVTARAEHIGSLLRPPELLAVRAAGGPPAALKAAEDRAIDAALATQAAVGLRVVTDGEFRRLSFQSQLPEAVEGFGDRDLDAFLADVVDLMRDEVAELARLGATYLQLDAPHYPLLLDPKTRAFYAARGWTLERWLALVVACARRVWG